MKPTPPVRALFLALLPALLPLAASCGGGGGGGTDQAAPPAGLAAPVGVHFAPSSEGAPKYLLRWLPAQTLAGVEHVVYRSDAPISEDNKQDAEAIPAAGDRLTVEILPDSGEHYFRVATRDGRGGEALSEEMRIDSHSQIFYSCPYDVTEDRTIMSTSPLGGPVHLYPTKDTLTYGYRITLGGSDVLALTNDVGFQYEVVQMPFADGDSRLRLSPEMPPGYSHYTPSFYALPDGKHVAITGRFGLPDEANKELFVATLGVADSAVRISDPSDGTLDSGLWPSPDGLWLAYRLRLEGGGLALYVVPTAGTQAPRRLSPEEGPGSELDNTFGSQVDFHPDGRRIGYIARGSDPSERKLYIVPLAGGAPVEVGAPAVDTFQLGDGTFGVNRFAWSPEGEWLAYRTDSQDGRGESRLLIVRGDGSGEPKTVAPLAQPDTGFSAFEFTVDGKELVFRADAATDQVTELFKVDVADPSVVYRLSGPMVEGGDVSSFELSPDGSRVVYRADAVIDDVRELWVRELSGGNPAPVHESLSAGQTVLEYAVSPDGSLVAFSAEREEEDKKRLYVSPIEGLATSQVLGLDFTVPNILAGVAFIKWASPVLR